MKLENFTIAEKSSSFVFDATPYLSKTIIDDWFQSGVMREDSVDQFRIFVRQMIGTFTTMVNLLEKEPEEKRTAALSTPLEVAGDDEPTNRIIVTSDEIRSFLTSISGYYVTQDSRIFYPIAHDVQGAIVNCIDEAKAIVYTINDKTTVAAKIGDIVSIKLDEEEKNANKDLQLTGDSQSRKQITRWEFYLNIPGIDTVTKISIRFERNNDTQKISVMGEKWVDNRNIRIAIMLIAWNILNFITSFYREKYLSSIQTTKKTLSVTLGKLFTSTMATGFVDLQKSNTFPKFIFSSATTKALTTNPETFEQEYIEFWLNDKEGTPCYAMILDHSSGEWKLRLFDIDGMSGDKTQRDLTDEQHSALMEIVNRYLDRTNSLVVFAVKALDGEIKKVNKALGEAPWKKTED